MLTGCLWLAADVRMFLTHLELQTINPESACWELLTFDPNNVHLTQHLLTETFQDTLTAENASIGCNMHRVEDKLYVGDPRGCLPFAKSHSNTFARKADGIITQARCEQRRKLRYIFKESQSPQNAEAGEGWTGQQTVGLVISSFLPTVNVVLLL